MPSSKKILVTGGAGFIASHLVDQLVAQGHAVTVLDNLEPQVHAKPPQHLNPRARYLFGDARDRDMLRKALADQEVVFHQAAQVGVGQSMYQIEKYVDHCTMATARLLDVLVNEENQVKKLVVASSMSIYGEGLYECPDHGKVSPLPRPDDALKQKRWEQRCPECGKEASPLPTPESKPRDSQSVYAIAKKDQEEYSLVVGRAYGIPTVALRYFNVYGPRQSLSNPYTGVCAIFMSRIKNGNRPVVYEDGHQTRDFVSVHDIVRANLLAMEKSGGDHQALNVGTGRPTSILDVANVLVKLYGSGVTPEVTHAFRPGDIRHCVADIGAIRKALGYEPKVAFEEGMKELIAWGRDAEAVDRFDEARKELSSRGLM